LAVALIAVRRVKGIAVAPLARLVLPVDEIAIAPGNFSVIDQSGAVVFKGSEIENIPSGV
jgi:hypothetical protein